MRPISVLAILAVLIVPVRVAASPRIIPQPWPRPLGVIVRDAKTIHLLEVKSVDKKGISFKVKEALKGKTAEAPFLFATVLGNSGCEGLFRVGCSVLCFRQGPHGLTTSDAKLYWFTVNRKFAFEGLA